MIAKLKNVVEKDHWLKILSENLDVREQLLRESLSSPKKPAMSKAEEKNEPMKKNSREERLCELLIALALKFGLYFGYLTNNLQNDHIVGSQLTEFYKYLIIYYNKTSMEVIAADGNIPSINANGFKEWLNSDFFASNNKTNPLNHLQLLDKLIILGEEEFFELEEASAKNEIIKLILDIKKNYYSKKMKEIEKAIIQAERIGSKSEVMALMEEMKSFSDELREL